MDNNVSEMTGVNRRRCYSVLLCLSVGVYSYSNFLVSTALIELQHQTNVSLTTASVYITCQYAGLIAGSVVTGLVSSRVNIYLYHACILVSLTAAVSVVPWCRTFSTMSIGNLFIGIECGSLYSLAVGEMMNIWGSTTSVPMNALKFMQSFGSMMVSLVVIPFLATDASSVDNTNTTNGQWQNMTSVSANYSGIFEGNSNANLVVPYAVASAWSVLLAVCLVVLYLDMYFKNRRIEMVDENFPEEHQSYSKLLMLLFSGLMFSISSCLSASFHSFFPVYNVDLNKWPEDKAVLATSVFRFSMLVARFFVIFISMYVSAFKLLVSSICLISIALTMLIVNGILVRSDNLVFGLSALYGLSVSPLNANVVNVIEQRVMPVRGRIAAFFVVCLYAGMTVSSPLMAYLMDTFSPMFFVYVLFAETIVLFISGAVLSCSVPTLGHDDVPLIEHSKNQNKDSVKMLAKEMLFELRKTNDQNIQEN